VRPAARRRAQPGSHSAPPGRVRLGARAAPSPAHREQRSESACDGDRYRRRSSSWASFGPDFDDALGISPRTRERQQARFFMASSGVRGWLRHPRL